MTAADEFYEAALRIADRKLDREGPFGPVLRPRLGTGHSSLPFNSKCTTLLRCPF